MTGWFEVWKDGAPTSYFFLSEENARLWIALHSADGADYTIRPYQP